MKHPRNRSAGPAADPTRPMGVASARHQGLHRPRDDRRIQQALADVGLDDEGDVLEDHLRNRRRHGAPPAVRVRGAHNDTRPSQRR